MKKLSPLLILAFMAVLAFQACKTKKNIVGKTISDTTNMSIANIQKKSLLQKNDTIKNNASVQADDIKVQGGDTTVQNNKLKTQTKDTTVYYIVEQMPEFPGGEVEFKKYIAENLDFSDITEPWKVRYVRFIVTKTGKLDSIRIISEINPILEERVIRLFKSLPAWTPGKSKGKPVNVWQNIAISKPF
jgi:hypothetical protein